MVRTKVYTKEKILKVAEKILINEGFSNLTARNIADKMGISTQPIYLEFVNMEDVKQTLLYSVSSRVQKQFFSEKRVEDVLINLGLNFIQFAQANKKLYTALFLDSHGYGEEVNKIARTFFEEKLIEDTDYQKLSEEERINLFNRTLIVYVGMATGIMVKNVQLTEHQEIQMMHHLLGRN